MSETGCPEEFKKVISDFINDIKMTFPEYAMIINKYFYGEVRLQNNNATISDEIYDKTFNFCKTKYAPRFFDILYQNTSIFEEDSTEDTEFLPNIYFKNLWSCDISDKTKETIWKYLQLILFSAVGKVDDEGQFGETLKLFEAINDGEFKDKLDETFEGIKNMFEDTKDASGESFDVPNPEDMHEHISGLLKGKLGNLATEIAEDITGDLNIDEANTGSVNDLFSNMIKDPSKLMGIVNKVTNKLEGKIKSGDIKESELLSEATEMMQQMKNMPGMGNMQSLFSKMGMDMFGGGKVDTKATEQQLKRKMKLAKTKERIRAKAEANEKAKQMNSLAQMAQQQEEQQQEQLYLQNKISDEELANMFESNILLSDSNKQDKPKKSKKSKGKKKNVK
jgi:hypothetical protein